MAVTTTGIAVKDGNNASATLTTLTDPASNQRYSVSLDGAGEAVYRASASFTPQATSAVNLFYMTGSATKTVRIRKLMMMGVSTANASVILCLARTSALGAGGTLVTPTIGKVDSGTVASATAVATHTTTTLKATGTLVANLSHFRFTTSVVTTPTITPIWFQAFPEGGSMSQSIVLRGATDYLEVQLVGGGSLSAGTVIEYVWEWSEDAS